MFKSKTTARLTFPAAALLCLVLSFGAASCASTSVPAPPIELRALSVFDGSSGEAATWQEIEARIDKADVVIIGELHGHPVGLPFSALLFEGSLERNPDTALALEFIARDRQSVVDAYLAGLIDFEELEEAMEGSPGSTATPHGPMIQAANKAGRPVIAANAPRIYTRTARKRGYEALTDLSSAQQDLYDVPEVMPSGGYRDRFFALMGRKADTDDDGTELTPEGEEVALPEPTKRMKSVFRSQSLWDGTMSTSVSRAVDQGNRPVFLVVGQFHCDRDGGTLQLIRRRQPGANVLVISVTDSWSESLLEDDKDRADYIVYVGPFPDDE